MKKALFTAVFIILAISSFAQINTEKDKKEQDSVQTDNKITGKNDISTNLFLLGLLRIGELSYERLFNNTGVGISASVDLGDIAYNFAFIPYYRVYYGKKKASGFFIEGNAVFWNAQKSSRGIYGQDGTYIVLYRVIENRFGFGVAAGGKFLNKKGFVGEIFGGMAKLFGGNDADDYFPRIGFTIGKRF